MTIAQRKRIIENAMERIYLDHAATTPTDKEVLEKMLPYFTDAFANADSPHGAGRRAMGAVDEARDTVAALLNANKNEIYFTSGGTEADNWAMLGAARAKKEEGKTKIVVSAIEHHAVLSAAERLEKEGFKVEYLPVNADGKVEETALEKAIDNDTALVCLMWANNETGAIQPIETAERLAHEHGALFFTDAVQAAPYTPIDVKKIGADLLSFFAHKFYGPKGVGVLYIKGGVRMQKLVGGGEQERGMRGGTTNVPAVVGLAAAYKKAREQMEQNNAKILQVREKFLKGISCLTGVEQNGGTGLPAVLNLRFDGIDNTAFLFNMDLNGVCVAAGSACASASVKPSHVLTAMGLTEGQAKSSVRFSFGKDNTDEEIEKAVSLTLEIVKKLRTM